MFQKKVALEPTVRATGRPASGPETRIAEGVRVNGDLVSPSGVELRGTVEGNLEANGTLLVRESGRVLGNVTAREVTVEGVVEGQVTAMHRIELGASGRVQGDLKAGTVSIADGAFFQGRVEMTDASDPSRTERQDPKVGLPQPAAV